MTSLCCERISLAILPVGLLIKLRQKRSCSLYDLHWIIFTNSHQHLHKLEVAGFYIHREKERTVGSNSFQGVEVGICVCLDQEQYHEVRTNTVPGGSQAHEDRVRRRNWKTKTVSSGHSTHRQSSISSKSGQTNSSILSSSIVINDWTSSRRDCNTSLLHEERLRPIINEHRGNILL